MDPLSAVRSTLSERSKGGATVFSVLKRSQWSLNDTVLDDAKPCVTLEIL
jgi:hypothetical protein